MASLSVTKDLIALCARNRLLVLQQSSGEICLDFKHVAAKIEDSPKNDKVPEPDDEQNRNLSQCKFSPSGIYLSTSTSDKIVIVWNTQDWSVLFKIKIVKRPIKMIFTSCENYLLVADKTGDVTRICLQTGKSDFLMGHLSTVLDMSLTNDDKILITSDRDYKIRMSHYPNCYNIDKYLLAHTNFVSCVGLTPNGDHLVSGGGDGKIILWRLSTGLQIDSLSLNDEESTIVRSICIDDKMNVFAIAEKLPKIFCFKIEKEHLVRSIDVTLTHAPIDIVCIGDDVILIQANKQEIIRHFRAQTDGQYRQLSTTDAPYLGVLEKDSTLEAVKDGDRGRK
eukprot:gene11889-13121_t